MSKNKQYVCTNCGYKTIGFLGKCPGCNSFGSMEIESNNKENIDVIKGSFRMTSNTKPKKLESISGNEADRHITNISEFDRVMGGGVVVDSVNVITAPPGTGKSTLLLSIANSMAQKGLIVLYLSGEESESQIKLRGDRILDVISENLYVKAETNLERIESDIVSIKPEVLIIDSIQTIYSDKFPDAMPGGPKQISECTSRLIKIAKSKQVIDNFISVFLVGQMTKENELRGDRGFEHMVDAVFKLEGEAGSNLRVFRGTKNRFGSTEEVGLFEMTEKGLSEISNPAKHFLTEREKDVSGVALTSIKEGSRNITIEIEALTEYSGGTVQMRVGEGISKNKLQIMVAILSKRANINFSNNHLYVKMSTDLKTTDAAIDLALLMSIYSAHSNTPISSDTVFLGEVSLTGEVKKVVDIDGRIKDLDRMGFKNVFVPKNSYNKQLKLNNINVIEVYDISETINYFK